MSALVAFVVLATLLALDASAQAQLQPLIRIGVSLSLTGSFAQMGREHERGYRLCVKQANDRGGVLGRKIELRVEDDRSDAAIAVAIYEKLIAKDKVNAVFSPYSSPITEAVADVTERYGMPMVSAGGATTAIFKKGRKFIFMAMSPAETYFEGLVDLAAKRGLKTMGVLYEDTLFPKAATQGAIELAKKRGLQLVFVEAYPKGSKDFSALLAKLRAVNPDVFAVATYFEDAVAVTRALKALDVNPRMFGITSGSDQPKFYELLGRSAEYVYGSTQWEAELVKLRAGGVIPIASRYPGAREFVENYEKQFPGAEPTYHSGQSYASCQILFESIGRAGSLDPNKVRAEISKFDGHTVFGAFRVDSDGFQVAHKMLTFQWQDGKKVIVWPEGLGPGEARFPTPPWSKRQ